MPVMPLGHLAIRFYRNEADKVVELDHGFTWSHLRY